MSRSRPKLHTHPKRGFLPRARNGVPDWVRARRVAPTKARGRSHWLGLMVAAAIGAAFVAVQSLPGPDLADINGGTVHERVTASTVRVGDAFRGTVTRIVDGDTFWISSADVRIRVWALDAPERDTPGFRAATGALRELIAAQTLTCRTRDIDRYGRIVGQCFLTDGRDITRAMIDSGTATEFCRFSGNHYGGCGPLAFLGSR